MPIYTDTDQKNFFPPELLKTLKGKSCFHIRQLDNVLKKQIAAALKRGYLLYRQKGWI